MATYLLDEKGFLTLRVFVLGISLSFGALGCEKHYGIGTSQLLEAPLAQHYFLDAPADTVWNFVTQEAESYSQPDCRILVKSHEQHLVTWCENVENWRDLGQDTAGPPYSPTGSSDPDKFNELVQTPGKGISLTTIRVEPLTTGCHLHIRRTYYGPKSAPGIAHSRGTFENALYQRLVNHLGLTSHET